LIIIDGGSKDGTVEILEENGDKINYWLSEPDRGIYNAWNKALSLTKGEWICFLGADDYFWNAQALERMSVELQKVPTDVCLVYAQTMLLGDDGEALFPAGEPWEKIKGRFRQALSLPHQATMHRRTMFERNGQFDESFRICGDYELMLRELITADALFVPNLILTGMRYGGISSNPGNSLAVLREMRVAQKKHGRKTPGIFWVVSYMKVCARILLLRLLGKDRSSVVLDLGRRFTGQRPFWTRAVK
jgi:glycosyltransferase involved in cell wall biosynthesis